MKEEKVYICDYCGAKYRKPDDAERCEKNHKQPKSIQAAFFKDRSSWYPEQIKVEFESGEEAMYQLR